MQIIQGSYRLLERLIYTPVNTGGVLLKTVVVICVVSVSEVKKIELPNVSFDQRTDLSCLVCVCVCVFSM